MIRSAFIAFILATFTLQAADLKIGVVDMSKVFQEFHKTKSAAEKYKGNYEKAAQEMQERQTVYKNLAAEAQKLQKMAQDPIITPDQRNKYAAELGEKVKEIRSMEMEMQEFAERRQTQLKQEDMQIRKGLYEEILVVVRDRSKADGYDIVFDKTGVSLSTVPIILHVKEGAATDLTDQLIVELNKDAPPPGADPKKQDAEAPKAEEPKK
ncbi:OmpH family outer membrane protein [Prosthecobacter sp.]|uniref:OmpH family outer membrane protein n=1 Tax=Prosthecobacter sp. TaxID=1965333 RepID=UPI001DDD1991|nr:OmpH family outer membrane protein [Prosthecobacter sp.]MCB1277190.1 OmpH family outer membrane protein [Prosthecobacter sp.]